MPPKSREFHRLVREILAPALADLGFSRPRGVGLGGWVREEKSGWLVIWVQLGKWNYGDDPEGYTFTVELQMDTEPRAGLGGSRARLHELLTDDEHAAHLGIHNEVILKSKPDPDLLAIMQTHTGAWYLSEFQPRSSPFGRFDDPWFRYTDEYDARRWLNFVRRVLPAAIERFVALASPLRDSEAGSPSPSSK